MLLKHYIIDKKEIKIKAFSVLENSLRLRSECIIYVEQVVEAHLFVPVFDIRDLFWILASFFSNLLVKVWLKDTLTFKKLTREVNKFVILLRHQHMVVAAAHVSHLTGVRLHHRSSIIIWARANTHLTLNACITLGDVAEFENWFIFHKMVFVDFWIFDDCDDEVFAKEDLTMLKLAWSTVLSDLSGEEADFVF